MGYMMMRERGRDSVIGSSEYRDDTPRAELIGPHGVRILASEVRPVLTVTVDIDGNTRDVELASSADKLLASGVFRRE